ncbi:TVP38/TMEM64 family protein [Desulfitobacterium sp. Sab5]|uniref:TVP38/TMEM64 family protein n=1 Tax=Desulfitobacterium nosdiversum TaxID=3375356 RepID=UPI003CF2BA1E
MIIISDRKNKVPILNLVMSIGLTLILIGITIRYAPLVIDLVDEPSKFREIIHSYGYYGVFVFLFFQILQTVIAPIPGEVVQIAGGFIYGVWLGTLYLLIGATLGSVIAFFASRLLGYPIVKAFVPEEKLNKFIQLMQSQKAEMVTFILFLLPGLPKDILCYIGGLTPINPLRFFIITIIARFPALFMSVYIGANLQKKNYFTTAVILAIAVLLSFLGFFFKDKVIEKISVHKHHKTEIK